ncbi:MAG: glycosyltransferase, partial [Chloroflexota bacterium]|nr:glycosyltransferase [Chloroflexota bacterium]
LATNHAYRSEGSIYYRITSFPEYGKLSKINFAGNIAGASERVDTDKYEKEDARDFALWKESASPTEPGWETAIGRGRPGWHIECSAMSTRYLGERFDLHTGGVDNIFPHHEDEIAQSEGALAHPVVGTWVHGQHLLADGVKMAKSARNTTEVSELVAMGIDPLAFRYQALLTHYRARMHFTLAALRQAAEGLDHLRQRLRHLAQLASADAGRGRTEARSPWIARFRERVHDDLDLPGALAIAHSCVTDASTSPRERIAALVTMDTVLGLDLDAVVRERETAPAEIRRAADARAEARAALRLRDADALRGSFDGWRVDDHPGRALISEGGRRLGVRGGRRVSSGAELEDRRAEPATRSWSVCLATHEFPEDLERCVVSVERILPGDAEILILDQGSSAPAAGRAAALADGSRDGRVRVVLADRDLGEGAGRNALLRIARGRFQLQLDTSVELTGDLFAPLRAALRAERVGAAGPWGLRARDHLKEFDEVTSGPCDAIQGYCYAARREDLLAVGGFDERYRFYRNLDIAMSLALREHGLASVAAGEGLAVRHAHRAWESLADDERQKRSRRNNDRLVRRFAGLGVGT